MIKFLIIADAKYQQSLHKAAFKQFRQYLEIMRKINSDEFLKLAEKQDYFEIGVTQVFSHKF